MRVNVIRGSNQIGGNIVEIATDKTKILLDIGLNLNEENNRTLPQIEGLFDNKGYQAIFISHYHRDHMGLLEYIHKDIPVYMSEMAVRIVNAGNRYLNRQSIVPNGTLAHKKPIVVGDITVTPYLCDHSAYDSFMLLCESGEERILYTGDFRAHGRKSSNLLKILPTNVDKLICEGTTLSNNSHLCMTESQLEKKAVELFASKTGPIFVLQSSTNIDRIVTMYRASKRTGRKFLQELYMAEVTSAIGGNIPNTESFDDVYSFILTPDERLYKMLKKHRRYVGINLIAKTKFTMCVRISMIKYLKALSGKMSFKDGVLVYSLWQGYKEDSKVKKFLTECQDLGLEIVSLHTSGHADSKTISRLIVHTNPKEIIPIHTENSDWFQRFIDNQQHVTTVDCND